MSTPLGQLLSGILFDDATRADFGADAEGFLSEHGWSTLEGAELHEAVAAVGDTMPVETTQAIDDALDGIDFSTDSLSTIGAELAGATADLSFGDISAPTLADAGHDLDFGAGAEAEADLSDNGSVDTGSVAHLAEELDLDEAPQAESVAPEFSDDAEGIDIGQPLVHDVDDTEVEFDLEGNDIDDLDI